MAVMDRQGSLAEAKHYSRAGDDREKAFARRLATGVVRWAGALEQLSRALLERPLKRRDRDIERLVQLGLYQLWHEDTPGHAAVHATAEVARSLRKPWAVGLVNAVLRRFTREREALLAALADNDAVYAHPDWLLEALREDWPDHWRDIVTANNQAPPLWLRANTRVSPREPLAGRLRDAGFTVSPHPEAPQALCVEPAAAVEQLPGFAEGACSVQDAAAQLAAGYLEADAGHRVLDACAAPGGKTCHLLESVAGVQVTALDNDARRMQRVRENLDRLSLDATLVVGDATRPADWWDGEPFDRILLDAPCSAVGVIRRHPEIKWQRSPGQVQSAVELQARMLDALWPLLRPGGILVYATCSVLKRENSKQIQRFLERTPDARHSPDATGSPAGAGRERQILTGENGMDGFFYAPLHKPA